jgi:O-antigen/teichoic acid export membrane protein
MLKNIFTVLSGTVLAQLIAVLGLPILGRIYDPADFGLFQVYVSSLSILLIFVAFRYELGLLSAENGKDFKSLLSVALLLCIVTPLLVVVALFVFGGTISEHLDGVGHELWLLPLLLIVAGFHQTLTTLPIRYRDYRLAARYKVVQSAGYIGAAFVMAFTPIFHIGIVLADSAGRALAALTVLRRMPPSDRKDLFKVTKVDAKDTLVRHRSFPIYTLPGALLSAVAAAMVPLAFARLFSLDVAGQYALVERFILMPIGMFAFSAYQVVTGDLAETIRTEPENVHRKFRKVVVSLGSIAIAFCVVGVFVMPSLIPFIFGPRWEMAGKLAQLAMPIAAISFVAIPVNMALLIANRRRLQLTWEIGRFIAMLATFAWMLTHPNLSPEHVMSGYVAVTVLSYLVFLLMADAALAEISKKNKPKQ